jgi:hypothetical protein
LIGAPGRFDFGSVATTSSYDVLSRSSISRRSSTSPTVRSCTHMARARYGAGMMPSRSVSSANVSGVHLNESVCGRSVLTTANILPPMLNARSLPHLISSVTAGSERQNVRTVSIDMAGNGRPEGLHYNWLA